MTQWMQCTTCKSLVMVNETGICLTCQGGFSSVRGPDDYESQQVREAEQIIKKAKEKLDALKERIEQEGGLGEHQDRDESRQAEETSSSDSSQQSWQIQEKEIDYTDVIYYAFRFFLGRQSPLINSMLAYLRQRWHLLPDATQFLIIADIKSALELDKALEDDTESKSATGCCAKSEVLKWKEFLKYVRCNTPSD